MKSKRIAALVAASIFCMSAPAAAKSDDQVWANGFLSVKLADRWRLTEEISARWSDGRNGLYEIESNTLLNYRVNKRVTVAAGYTHDPQYSDGELSVMEHRAREQVSFDGFATLGKAKLNGRIRLEQRWREHVDGIGWRMRPFVKYVLPIAGKTAFNVSSEAFVNLNRTSYQHKRGLDRVRNLISVSTPLTDKITAEAGYMNQHGFVRGGPDTSDNIAWMGVGLTL